MPSMKTIDIRRQNLRRLIAGAGSVKNLADKAGTNADWLSALASDSPPVTPLGTPRGIGSKLARALEKGTGMPSGWLDVPHTYTDAQKMWMNKLAELPNSAQEKELEYLDMLHRLNKEAKSKETPSPDTKSE